MSAGSNFIPCLAVLASIISLTVGTSFGKQLFPLVGPQGTASLRVIFAALLMMIVWRPWRQRLSLDAAKGIGLYGVILASMNLLFYSSLQTLPLGLAIAIEFTGPLTVAIVSSRKLLDFVWILLAVIGLALLLPIAPHAVGLDPRGVAFAFSAAVLWGLYIVVGKRIGHLPAGQTTSLGMFTAAIVALPFAVVNVGDHIVEPRVLTAGIAVAIASSAIPYTLEMYALRRLSKNTFGILLSMEPAIGALSAMLILHEALSFVQWCAIASIMLASVGSAVTSKGETREKARSTLEAIPADVL